MVHLCASNTALDPFSKLPVTRHQLYVHGFQQKNFKREMQKKNFDLLLAESLQHLSSQDIGNQQI